MNNRINSVVGTILKTDIQNPIPSQSKITEVIHKVFEGYLGGKWLLTFFCQCCLAPHSMAHCLITSRRLD